MIEPGTSNGIAQANAVGTPYVKLLERLREPIDLGGYDGFGSDALHISAADAIGGLIVALISQIDISNNLREQLRAASPTDTPLDLESKTPAGLPLTIGVEADQLVMRIGVDTLAFCFEISEDNQPFDESVNDFRRSFKVADRHKFAAGVAHELRVEEEDGRTPLTRILDEACTRAVEDDMGIEEDGRIVTHEMLHPKVEVA